MSSAHHVSNKKKVGIIFKNTSAKNVAQMSRMDPKIWGPPLWKLMRRFTFEYSANPTPEERRVAERFFTVDVFPHMYCDSCQMHWRQLMQKHPPDTRSAETLTHWFVDRKNDVNERLGQPVMKYEDVVKEVMAERLGLSVPAATTAVTLNGQLATNETAASGTATTTLSFGNSTSNNSNVVVPALIGAAKAQTNYAENISSHGAWFRNGRSRAIRSFREMPFDTCVAIAALCGAIVIFAIARYRRKSVARKAIFEDEPDREENS